MDIHIKIEPKNLFIKLKPWNNSPTSPATIVMYNIFRIMCLIGVVLVWIGFFQSETTKFHLVALTFGSGLALHLDKEMRNWLNQERRKNKRKTA